jgi:hypothetical protein
MEREKECIILASGSCRRDRLPRSGALIACSIDSDGFTLRWL